MEEISQPKKVISLSWDDPWKKYEERCQKNPKGENALLYSDIPRTERLRRRKKTKYSKKFRQWRNSMEVLSAVSRGTSSHS